LVIAQGAGEAIEQAALAAEQERCEIGIAQDEPVRRDARDLSNPCAADSSRTMPCSLAVPGRRLRLRQRRQVDSLLRRSRPAKYR
jgi:hypothetical protein